MLEEKLSRQPSPDMADESLLQQAWVLYKQGRFTAALESLEPRIFQFREEPAFFRILGLCCLRMGDWKGGETYLQRSRQLEETDQRDTLLGLMAVAARKKDYSEAVRIGLNLLDRDPRDSIAKKSLARLRVALASPEGAPGLDKETLGLWLPPYKKSNPNVKTWVYRGFILLAIVFGLTAGIWWGFSVSGMSSPKQIRQGPESLVTSLGLAELIQPGSGIAVTLSSQEISLGWERAQKAFQEYKDSQARFEINRILLSNASAPVKEKARSLIPYLHEPDFARQEDSSTYQQVRINPILYEGCTIRWKGVLTNLVSGEKKITFDLLLGYQDGQVVEGIVPVELSFAALLKNSQVVEVLGSVALRDGKWFVRASSLRDLGYRTP